MQENKRLLQFVLPLKDLPALKYLDLSDNPVTGANTVQDLNAFGAGKFLVFRGQSNFLLLHWICKKSSPCISRLTGPNIGSKGMIPFKVPPMPSLFTSIFQSIGTASGEYFDSNYHGHGVSVSRQHLKKV
jgi:hypothetical protein